MAVAKSTRRKKQDHAKAEARRAEKSRLRARAERQEQLADRFSLLLDPQAGPVKVAEVLAAEMPDSIIAGDMVFIRRNLGAPAEEVAEIARLMLANAPEPPGDGALAVAAWAAHWAGDEDTEHRHAGELLARADACGDVVGRLEVIRSISTRGHPGEACDLIDPYLREHPDDEIAAKIYAGAVARAHREAEPGERDRAALARFADRSGLDALRAAIGSFLDRTDWGEIVRKRAETDRAEAERKYWQPADRDTFDALTFELAITFPDDSAEDSGTDGEDAPPDTVLQAFAADPQVPRELAARASAWNEYVRYGVWQVADPVAAPGVWCTDLVTGTRRYAQFPAEALGGAAPWAAWLGGLLPVDGIWRSSGDGVWLSPAEGDAVAEYSDQMALLGLQRIFGIGREEFLEPGQVRFGQAEPYCVRWEGDDAPEPEFTDIAALMTARLITRLAARVWWKRSTPPLLQNTGGEPMMLIDATITVSGDVTGQLLTHPDFAEEDGEDDEIVWWGDRVDLLAPDGDVERWILGRITPGADRIRVRVNSQPRLARLVQILAELGLEPQVTEEKRTVPSIDFAWGPVPGGGAASAREWETNWLDQPVVPLGSRTPRQVAQGDDADAMRLEALLRQLEYQAGLAVARGERGIDVAWLRAELTVNREAG
jgi:hypothetical protein